MRTTALAAALFALISAIAHARQAPAPPDPATAYATTALTADRVELPFAHPGPHILIDGVMVNGKGPFRFLLDTGAAGGGRVDASLVEALKLETTGEALASDGSARATVSMKRHTLDSLSVGPLSFTGVEVISRDYNAQRPPDIGRIDGVLGFHLFREYLLTLNYPARTVTISKGALPPADARAVLTLQDESHLAGLDIDLAGRPVHAVIDSGNMGALSVPESMEPELKFTAPPQIVGEARTVSGPFQIKSATLDGTLRIGAIEITNPEITIAGPMRRVNLGARALAPLALTFDQKNARVRIERPAGAQAPPPEPKRYGLMIAMSPNADAPIELRGAVPGSIAERAGVRAGDRLIAINGRPIAQIPAAEIGTLLRASPLTIEVERGGARQEIRMTLEDTAPSAPPRSDASPGWQPFFDRMNGRTRIEARMFPPEPGAEPRAFTGSAEWSSAYDGRYRREQFTLTTPTGTLEGEVFLGPRGERTNANPALELVQIDSFSRSFFYVVGAWNPATNQIELERPAPASPLHGDSHRPLRWSYHLNDDGSFTKEMHTQRPDGSWRLASDYRYIPQPS